MVLKRGTLWGGMIRDLSKRGRKKIKSATEIKEGGKKGKSKGGGDREIHQKLKTKTSYEISEEARGALGQPYDREKKKRH